MLMRPMLLRAMRRRHRLAVSPQLAELLGVLLPLPQQAGRLLRYSLLTPLPLRRPLPRLRLPLPCSLLNAASASRIG